MTPVSNWSYTAVSISAVEQTSVFPFPVSLPSVGVGNWETHSPRRRHHQYESRLVRDGN